MVNLLITNVIFIIAFITILILFINKKYHYDKMFISLKKNKQNLDQLNALRDSMLEITQAVVGTEDPKDLYEMILTKTITAITKANVGSVLIRGQDGLFRSSSQFGFDTSKIEDFSLPLEETILWKFTKGRIYQTEIINNVTNIMDLKVHPLTVDPEEWTIQSTISVPLFIEGEIIGLLNIDSKEKNAFNHNDWTSMEYIRGNIEVALQKYLLYTRMLKLSRYDVLTGTFNRAYFMEQFHNLLSNAERYKQSFTLVILDINDLKLINDTKGHLTGDKIIQELAHTTMESIRKSDIFARWGGDEFMGLFYHISEKEINDKISSIKEILSDNPIKIGQEKINCYFSYGYSRFPDDGSDFDSLLKTADEKMYINKKQMKENK